MSDTAKEHKISAARSMLRQYQSRKGRSRNGSSTANTSGGGSQDSTTNSSRASSCELLAEMETSAKGHSTFQSQNAQSSEKYPVTVQTRASGVDTSKTTPDVNCDINNPAYRNASSIFPAMDSTNCNNDFLTESIKYAMSDASQNSDNIHHNYNRTPTISRYPDVAAVNFIPVSETSSVALHAKHPHTNSAHLINNNFSTSQPESGSKNLYTSQVISNFNTNGISNSHGNTPSSNTDEGSHSGISNHGRDSSVESDNTDTTAVLRVSDRPGYNSAFTPISAGNTVVDATDFNSSAESLRQISAQLQGLVTEAASIKENDNTTVATIEEHQQLQVLESRNSALLQQLHQQQYQLQQLSLMLQEAQKAQPAAETVAMPASSSGCSEEEVAQLRQQLHLHVQTVGILVAEKTHLEGQVRDLQHSLGSGGAHVTELEGRLAASRQTVDQLDTQLRSSDKRLKEMTSQKDDAERLFQLAVEEKDRLKSRCRDEELRSSELAERVNSSGRDQQSLQSQFSDTKTQLHMANIRVEQLRNSSGDSANILDELNQEKKSHLESEAALCDARQKAAQVEQDKTQQVAQYQLYTAQIQAHADQLQAQLAEAKQRNEQQDAQLQQHNQQLQQLSQQLHAQQASGGAAATTQLQLQQQLQLASQQLKQTQEQLQLRVEANDQLERDNLSLSQLSEEQRARVEQLEVAADRRNTEAVDPTTLMAKIQSDKVAAARALAQNKQLKDQLAELQDGFVMMSNKKLEVTEKLERELHTKKALHQQVTDHKTEAQGLREAFALREREVAQLRESCSSLSAQLAVIKQRQKEQQHPDQLETLHQLHQQSELQLQQLQRQDQEQMPQLVVANGGGDSLTSVPDIVPKLANIVVNDKNVVDANGNDKTVSSDASTTVPSTEGGTTTQQPTNSSVVPPSTDVTEETPSGRSALLEYRLAQLSATHSQLVERFQRAMAQLAQLSDDKQVLEVTIEQLQLENDTIGDYITLYQFRRGVLTQQMREQQLELDRLRGNRQTLQEKLVQLQELIVGLAGQRGDGASSGGLLASLAQILAPDPPQQAAAAEPAASGPNDVTSSPGADPANPAAEKVPVTAPLPLQQAKGGGESATVTRILDLIREMEVGPSCENHALHPCSLCSGSLLTV